jgi:uncharacterized membrane protein
MNSTQHRLVASYLQDLTRALADVDPADRAEVLAGVREHIDAGVAARGGASDADFAAVLTELGSPEDVAREAYSSGQYAERSAPYPAVPPARPRLSDRSWVPVSVAVLQTIGVLMIISIVGALSAVVTTVEVTGDASAAPTQSEAIYTSTLPAVLGAAVFVMPLWIATALLVGNSGLWATREKVLQVLLLPVVGLLLWVATDVAWAVGGERALNISSIATVALIIAGGAWLIVRLTTAARRRCAG